MLNLAIRVFHRLRLCCACRLRRWARLCCQIAGQRQNRLFLSHIRTPFGRTFIAHPAYREKQRKSPFRGSDCFRWTQGLGLGVGTGGTDLCLEAPQAAWNRVALESCNRGSGARVR
jgi:hypothetical protein